MGIVGASVYEYYVGVCDFDVKNMLSSRVQYATPVVGHRTDEVREAHKNGNACASHGCARSRSTHTCLAFGLAFSGIYRLVARALELWRELSQGSVCYYQ